jgi:hypothetical protein
MGWSGRAPALPARQAGKGPCVIGMEARTGTHHLSRKLQALGHDARLMPTNYVRPYSKADKNDYRDAERIRHVGGAKLNQALIRNVRTCAPDRLENRRKPAIQLDEEQPVAVRQLDPTAHLTLQNHQLIAKRGILCFKSALGPEERGTQVQKKEYQCCHRGRS